MICGMPQFNFVARGGACRLRTSSSRLEVLVREKDSFGGVYQMDGRNITVRGGLYCAPGETLRGPGGYFGSTLDAFKDCLSGGSG
ncbi:barstar family protein [Streptoalloteichus tenebrarius]|uniref:barstar family protein n=1 Tax=Streptoalloteichus tenebrarius (strain ATCC 17920 / DSM 40477 / JCM 4838 / CBS 697.72 / NBRC 16177 / NCIMB 11028 / NRRL B-12390 / A12253. 1 / ISP 5477) TaxID=1933 RepID=UPI003FD84AA0